MLLAAGLFAFHAFVLMETGKGLIGVQVDISGLLGHRLADPLAVFVAFSILFVTHMLEALAWGAFFRRLGQFGNLDEAVYFAGTSLTALGYGDIVLKRPWQRLGPVMATNGILMYGCSTAFLFLVIQKIWAT
jgi:hypothetical protein